MRFLEEQQFIENETKRAMIMLERHFREGSNVEEAFNKIKNSYGTRVYSRLIDKLYNI